MSDDEIDYSDIPKITEEEWRTRFKPVRLRKKNLNISSWQIISDENFVGVFLCYNIFKINP